MPTGKTGLIVDCDRKLDMLSYSIHLCRPWSIHLNHGMLHVAVPKNLKFHKDAKHDTQETIIVYFFAGNNFYAYYM